jgi:hypothetical protein
MYEFNTLLPIFFIFYVCSAHVTCNTYRRITLSVPVPMAPMLQSVHLDNLVT